MLNWKYLRGTVGVSNWGVFEDLSWLSDAVKKEFEKTISDILPDFQVNVFLDKEKNDEIMVELMTPLGEYEFEGTDFFVSLRDLIMDTIENEDEVEEMEKYRNNLQSITDELTKIIEIEKENGE